MKMSNSILKALVLLFAVVLFIGFTSMPMHLIAASAVQLAVSDASGKAGDDVTVSITISPNSKLGAAGILLKYDASKLEYKEHTLGAASIGSLSVVNPDYRPKEGNFKTIFDAFVNAEGLDSGGSLLDITFKIKSGWSGATPLVLTTNEFVNPNDYKEIAHNVINGNVTIGAPTTADVTTVATTGTSTTKPGDTTTTKPTTTKPTTTRTEVVTDKDGANVTETDKAGSTVNKTTVIYETVARTEFVTEKDGSKVTEKDAVGSTVNKTTLVYERVVGTEYVTDEAGEKVTETDESGSTVYATSLVYETVDGTDLPDENDTKDNGVMGSLSTAKKTALIIAFACLILVAAVLVAYTYKKKKDSAK